MEKLKELLQISTELPENDFEMVYYYIYGSEYSSLYIVSMHDNIYYTDKLDEALNMLVAELLPVFKKLEAEQKTGEMRRGYYSIGDMSSGRVDLVSQFDLSIWSFIKRVESYCKIRNEKTIFKVGDKIYLHQEDTTFTVIEANRTSDANVDYTLLSELGEKVLTTEDELQYLLNR